MKNLARRRRLSQSIRNRQTRAKLHVEQLEDRRLLYAADLLAGSYDPKQILVGDVSGHVQSIDLPAGLSVADALAQYDENPLVAFAEPDYVVHAAVIPNDSSFGVQYALNNTGQSGGLVDADIDAPEAWGVSTGSTEITVGIIDTGIDYGHQDLYLNVWINQDEIPPAIRASLTDTDGDSLITFWDLNDPVNQGAGKITDRNGNGRIDGGDLLAAGGWADGIDQDPYVVGSTTVRRVDDLIGWDFVSNDNNPFDDNGHGTHVAGTIGAIGNNGVGVSGVVWKTQLAALKFLSASGSGSISAATAALNYAIANGMEITNNSWGGGGFSTTFANALSAANTVGQIFVAAAGNDSANNDATAHYPSNYNFPNVVAVAATSRLDDLASFSNYGATTVDLGAPGTSILSTYPGGSYATLSGTSMATPHVTGAAALVLSEHPDWTYTDVIASLLDTADPIAALALRVASGGRLNVNDAVRVDLGDPPPPPEDTTGARITSLVPNSSVSASSVRLTFSEAIDPATFDTLDVTSFIGPAGSIAISGVAPVASSGGRQFDVTFALQSAPGTYTIVIGPDIRDLAGNAMDQSGDGTSGGPDDAFQGSFTLTATQTFTNSTAVTIRDLRTTVSSITIGQNISIAELNVRLNISHTYDSDLFIYLRGPDGTAVVLVNRRGGSGNNFTNTTLDDEAAVPIASGAAPFAGSFRPEGPLSALDGKSALGTWSLVIEDRARFDAGRLNSWSLIVTANAGSTVAANSGAADSAAATVWGLATVPSAPVELALNSLGSIIARGAGHRELCVAQGTSDSLPTSTPRYRQIVVTDPARDPARLAAITSEHVRAGVSSSASDALFAEIGESTSQEGQSGRLASLLGLGRLLVGGLRNSRGA